MGPLLVGARHDCLPGTNTRTRAETNSKNTYPYNNNAYNTIIMGTLGSEVLLYAHSPLNTQYDRAVVIAFHGNIIIIPII